MFRKLLAALALMFPVSAFAAFGDVVQCVADPEFGTAATTVDDTDGWSTPTDGNTIFMMMASKAGLSTATVLYSETSTILRQSFDAAPDDSGVVADWQYFESDGTETSFTATLGSAPTNFNFMVCEVDTDSNDDGVSDAVFNEAKENQNFVLTTGNQAQASGTAQLTGDSGFAVSFLATRRSNTWQPTLYSNGFTEAGFATTDNSVSGIRFAIKELTSSGPVSLNFTTSDDGDPTYGSIATFSFVDPGGGGASEYCVEGEETLGGTDTGDPDVFQPCIKTNIPDLDWTQDSPVTPLAPGYYITCGSGAWSGTLPTGVSFTTNVNGFDVISGTPTGSGIFAASVTCTNNALTVTDNFTITIAGTGTGPALSGVCYDPVSGDDGAAGTCPTAPVQSLAQAETLVPGLNGRIYQLGGTTETITSTYTPSSSGSDDANRAVLGCYEVSGSDAIACDSDTHATLVLDNSNVGDPVIRLTNKDYFTIDNIHVHRDPDDVAADQFEKYGLIEVTGDSDWVNLDEIKCELHASQAALVSANVWPYKRIQCIQIEGTSDDGRIRNPDIQYMGWNGIEFNDGQTTGWEVFCDGTSTYCRSLYNWEDSLRWQHFSSSTQRDAYLYVHGLDKDNLLQLGGSWVEDAVQIGSDYGSGIINNWFIFDYIHFTGVNSEQSLDAKDAADFLVQRYIATGNEGDNSGPTDGEDFFTNGAFAVGTGSITDRGIFRWGVCYDNAGCVVGNDGWRVYQNTMHSNNRTYQGTAQHTGTPGQNSGAGDEAYLAAILATGGAIDANFYAEDNIMMEHNDVEETYRTFPSGTLDNNMFYNTQGTTGSGARFFDCCTEDVSWKTLDVGLAQWVTDSGLQANSTEQDPELVNVPQDTLWSDWASYDFNLGPTSPARGAAQPRGTITGNSSGATISVNDACRFWPRVTQARWTFTGDYVKVDTETQYEVLSRDCSSNTLTLDGSVSASTSDEVDITESDGTPYDDIGGCQVNDTACRTP